MSNAAWQEASVRVSRQVDSLLRGRHEADREDLCQIVLMKAFQSRRRPEDVRGSWLYVVSWRSIIDLYRKGVRQAEAFANLSGRMAQPRASRSEPEVLAQLRELPEKMAETVRLRASGMSYEEVAAFQGVPVGTVRSRIHYARKRLA